ncbi:secretion protein EccK [Mycolicibacterium sp. GCM10028919]|uniref:secretion protein EccK n=1 Tax=Mycolicibacterium sp. GCM10028919 TaxID=3273401 RepID=UPI00360CE020
MEATNKSVPVAQQPVTPSAASPLQPVTPPVMPTEPAASTHAPAGGSGGGSGGGMGGGAGASAGGGPVGGGAPSGAAPASPPPPPMPLAPPSTPTPAAPTGPPGGGSGANPAAAAGPGGPGVHAASAGRNDAGAVGAAPVPVSTARMERDAIASASAGGATNRKKNGNAALIMARRIAAALNIGVSDFGFYWVTGLTADGSILVANSYGLAYIPEGVNLPAHVTMATADETLPPQERAKWATYPILAIQGWAQAHAQKLRAVIATEEQFASFDPGTAKIVLRPDDIPESGTMEGRSRLEVIAPNAAARLAAVPNADLTELLPPAPANTAAPEDKSNMLWFELIKPLMSTSPERVGVHLQAFINYAEHAQEQALYRAHTAVDAEVQRAAIADWVYWQHLSVLMWEASGAEASV